MARLNLSALALIAALALGAVLPWSARADVPKYAEAWNGAEINWRDARSGIYEASSTKRPVLMLVHATWCSVCKRFQAIFKDPRIVEASRDFVMILVDADTEKEINGAFSPDGTYVPRTLFIDPEGNISDRLVGPDPKYPHTVDVESPEQLLSLMKAARGVFTFPPDDKDAAPADGADKT